MLRELVELSGRLADESGLVPVGYKSKAFRWVVDVDPSGKGILQGYDRRTLTRPVPDRQRSGTASLTNLKPYLLADDARYALGVAEPGKEQESEFLHRAFVELVDRASDNLRLTTGTLSLEPIQKFLQSPLPTEMLEHIQPRDWVTFRADGEYPVDWQPIKQFWRTYVAGQTASSADGECGICGNLGSLVQTLPQEVVIMGQKCQITSFTPSAFASMGKKQTTNAAICSTCAQEFIHSLQRLSASDGGHSAALFREPRRGVTSLRNQLAIFWLKEPVEIKQAAGEPIDLEQAIAGLLSPVPLTLGPESEGEALDQLERLLKVPWTGQERAVRLDENIFHLAVLSANKGRLVVREWIAAPLSSIRENLAKFLAALRLVPADGSKPRPVPIPRLLEALGTGSGLDTRALLRTAYLGLSPPTILRDRAVQLLRIPRHRNDDAEFHALAAAIKLVSTYGTEEALRMETLDDTRKSAPYLCGCLLAALERAQRLAATSRLNTTIVDRSYGAASAAPRAYLGGYLLPRALRSHLAKLHREQRGIDIEKHIEDLVSRIEGSGGFPSTLSLEQQADFALGFFVQRAAFRAAAAERATRQATAANSPA